MIHPGSLQGQAQVILKAALWSNAGSKKERRISWGSSSDRVEQESAVFSGKMILLTNTLPNTQEAKAFLSRTLHYRFTFTKPEVQEMLLQGASSREHFPKSALAKKVATWIVKRMDSEDGGDHSQINLRTLAVGYDLAESLEDDWEELLETVVFGSANAAARLGAGGQVSKGNRNAHVLESPRLAVARLAKQPLPIARQLSEFQKMTGLSRRTFFLYRKEMRLSAKGKS